MGSANILRLLEAALNGGAESLDLVSGDVLKVLPETDDTGSINIGDGTNDMDVKVFLGSSDEFILFDVGNSRIDEGADGKGVDHRFFGETASSVMTWDQSADQLVFDNADIQLGDNDQLRLGDATSGDLALTWNGTFLQCGPATGMWVGAPSPADPNYHATAYDFYDHFTMAPSVGATGVWLETKVDADTDGGETYTLADDGVGGLWEIVTNDADNDSEAFQANGEMFKPAAGKTIWFECRFKVDDAGLCEYCIGLAEAVAGDGIDSPDDCLCFVNQDGTSDETIKFVGDKATAQDLNDTSVTLVDDTFVTVGFKVNGVTSVDVYVNGTLIAAAAVLTANIPVEALSPIVSIRNASAAVSTLTIDYIKCVQLV